MAKCLAIVAFIIGLLKFAQDAPDLIKKVFSGGLGGGLLNGIDLNPKGQIKKNLDAAKKTVSQAKGFASGVAHAPGRAFKAGVKGLRKAADAPGNIKRGVAGAAGGIRGKISGAKAGYNAAKGKGFSGWVSGLEGFIDGGEAGKTSGIMAGRVGELKNAGNWASKSAEEAAKYSAENKKNFSESKTQYGTMMDQFNNVNKAAIDKLTEQKTENERQYRENVREQMRTLLSGPGYNMHNSGDVYAAKKQKLDDLVAAEAKARGVSEAAIRADAITLGKLRGEAARMSNAEAVNYKAQHDAEAIYKAGYEKTKNRIDYDIATKKADGMKGQESAVQMTVANLKDQMSGWGEQISLDMQSKFNDALKDMNNPALIKALNDAARTTLGISGDIAGRSASETINLGDIAQIANALQASGENVALSQIMNTINSTAKKVDTSATIMQTANQTYNPQPTNDSKGNDGKK